MPQDLLARALEVIGPLAEEIDKAGAGQGERLREGRDSVGRKLIDVPGYTFRVFVTSSTEAPLQIWRDYNRRADMENRIAELKHDLGADGFCLKQFFATEAAFRSILLLFNLLGAFQRAAGLPGYRAPATIRTQIGSVRAKTQAPSIRALVRQVALLPPLPPQPSQHPPPLPNLSKKQLLLKRQPRNLQRAKSNP